MYQHSAISPLVREDTQRALTVLAQFGLVVEKAGQSSVPLAKYIAETLLNFGLERGQPCEHRFFLRLPSGSPERGEVGVISCCSRWQSAFKSPSTSSPCGQSPFSSHLAFLAIPSTSFTTLTPTMAWESKLLFLIDILPTGGVRFRILFDFAWGLARKVSSTYYMTFLYCQVRQSAETHFPLPRSPLPLAEGLI